mmetsp:Transcript_4298/g.17117  ORF Transcript_4298/g.17117 Transcript_4298/m.17117 type:complete len:230 (+) Transcript_4298:903-1592(+)
MTKDIVDLSRFYVSFASYSVRLLVPVAEGKLRAELVAQSLFGDPAVVRHLLALRDGDAPLARVDLRLVDAGDTLAHVPLRVELPVLVAVGAEPLPVRVAVLVLEAHRDAVVVKRPQVLAQHVVQLAVPLARQEIFDLRSSAHELGAVAPLRVLGVRHRDGIDVLAIPSRLRRLDLLQRRLRVERGERRPRRVGLKGLDDRASGGLRRHRQLRRGEFLRLLVVEVNQARL